MSNIQDSMPPPHLFGPVYSRRLGLSLGIDLVPQKTCTYDCVYCECGGTTVETKIRQEYYPVSGVIRELEQFLSSSPKLDFITFSGSGEPTLSTSIGPVIMYLKDAYPQYRIAVLTNGSLLTDPEVRKELNAADVVLPTLSTVVDVTFSIIHHPASCLHAGDILDGMVKFREEYPREIWLEVFIIPGVNTSPEELSGLKEALLRIRADRVQINTLDRPGTKSWVTPASPAELSRIINILDCPVAEIIPSEHVSLV